MRSCSFTHNISSIWKCDTASITLFVCEHFCCTIFPDHNWCCRSKLIVSVCFLCQGRFQICRKSGTFQQISVCFSIIGCFDDLERLFHYLLQWSAVTFNLCYQIAFIIADQIMFCFVCQITHWRTNLFHIVISKIQAIYRSLSILICCKSSNLLPGFIDHTGNTVRMNNIITSVQSINCFFQCRISLCNRLFCFRISLFQRNLCFDSLIYKCMSEWNFRLTVTGIWELKCINIFRISQISLWCLFLFDYIRKSNRKICVKCRFSICSCR